MNSKACCNYCSKEVGSSNCSCIGATQHRCIVSLEQQLAEALSKGMGVSAECSVLDQQLAKYSEDLNIERIKVDMLERKLEIAVEFITTVRGATDHPMLELGCDNILEKLKEKQWIQK